MVGDVGKGKGRRKERGRDEIGREDGRAEREDGRGKKEYFDVCT